MRAPKLVFTISWVSAALCATLFAACGIDEGGTQTDAASQDVTLGDVVIDVADAGKDVTPTDTYVPPTCATIDASCLGLDVPDGWSLFDLSDAATACPGDDENWDPHMLVTNPRLTASSCSCGGCTVSGGYACSGNVEIIGGNGSSCNDQDAAITNSAQCVSLAEDAGLGCVGKTSVSVTIPAATGTPVCDASFSGNQLAMTDSFLGCRPVQCTTPYCGQAGFRTCIVHNGDPSGICPAGYHPFAGSNALATAAGGVLVSCGTCGCAMGKPAPCTGQVRVFSGGGNYAPCDGDGSVQGLDYVETVDATSACQSTGICNYTSLYYVPGPEPLTLCSGAVNAGGTASLQNAVTICCAP